MANDRALIIIDMQAGVFDGERIPPVSDAERLLSNVKRLVEKARHSAVPLVYVQHNGTRGHPLERGTSGWMIHPDLEIAEGDHVVQKHTPDAFYQTDLQKKLNSLSINRIVIAGIQTEYCIDTTCRRGYGLDYEVTLAEDAHGTWDTDRLSASQIIDHHNTLLGEWFVSLEEADRIEFDRSSPDGG